MTEVKRAHIVAAMGSSGSGKTAYVKQAIAGESRLLVWDCMDEYGDIAQRAPDLSAMVQCIAKREAFRIRYVPHGSPKELARRFDTFCQVAYAAGDLAMVVEELQTVTQPTWAPARWSDCTLRGRHKRMRVYGISQRPASVDKNFLSNATSIRTGRLNFADDARCMAKMLGVRDADVLALKPLQWIERDMHTGETSRGVLTFEKKPAKRGKPEEVGQTAH